MINSNKAIQCIWNDELLTIFSASLLVPQLFPGDWLTAADLVESFHLALVEVIDKAHLHNFLKQKETYLEVQEYPNHSSLSSPIEPRGKVLIRFGEFWIQNDGRFSEGAALDDINAQKIKKCYKRNLTGQEMIEIGLELRISAPSDRK